MPLTGLAADVDVAQVRALLLNRSPNLLDEDASPTEHDLFVESANGIGTEVRAIVGDPAADSDLRAAAVWAVTLGAAHLIEAALFPEQQLGEFARAEVLRRRYESVLKLLGSANKDTGVVDRVASAGAFPDPVPYPDPARPAYAGNWFGPGYIS